jgi:uncharacterized protein (UPF0262 family)
MKPEKISGKNDKSYLVDIELDEASLASNSRNVDHERQVAIYDLLENNHFQPVGHNGGPYKLRLSIVERRLVWDITDFSDPPSQVATHLLSLTPLRKIVKDYFLICESYFEAIKSSSPRHIEAIDMGRRGLHNEGSEILRKRLKDKIEVDFDTARRLFTLVCVLHWKG